MCGPGLLHHRVLGLFLHDRTSSKLLLVGLSINILHRGLGPVGCIHAPLVIWQRSVFPSFLAISRGSFSRLRPASDEGNIIARALIGKGVLRPVHDPDLGPSGSFFPVPKYQEKASCIVNLVAFNESMRSRPPPLQIPSQKLAAILMLVQDIGNLHSLPPRFRGDCDRYIALVCGMFSLRAPGQGEPLLACYMYINS